MNPLIRRIAYGLGALTVLTLSACGTLSPSRSSNITFNGVCEQKDETGYYDFIRLNINRSQVQELNWTASPRQGSCQFDLADFKQVASSPQTDLQSLKDRRCHIYIWQNAEYISVSVLNCQKVCAQNDRILSVLLNPKTGGCQQK